MICTGQFLTCAAACSGFFHFDRPVSCFSFFRSASCFACCTAASSYAGASLSSKVIAPAGHAGRQSPSPSQKCSLARRAFPSTISIAPSWQAAAQIPQPLHLFSSMCMIFLIISVLFLSLENQKNSLIWASLKLFC